MKFTRWYPFQCSAGLLEISLDVSSPEFEDSNAHLIDHCVAAALTELPSLFCALEAQRPIDAPDGSVKVPAKIKLELDDVKFVLDVDVALNFRISEDSQTFDDIQTLLYKAAMQLFNEFCSATTDEIESDATDVIDRINRRESQLAMFDALRKRAYSSGFASSPREAMLFSNVFGPSFADGDISGVRNEYMKFMDDVYSRGGVVHFVDEQGFNDLVDPDGHHDLDHLQADVMGGDSFNNVRRHYERDGHSPTSTGFAPRDASQGR